VGTTLALTLCLVGPAAAGVAGDVQPQPDAPIQITRCTASVQFVSNGWGTAFSRLNTGVDFRNASTKTIVAALFRLKLSDAFGDALGNLFGQASGQFSPDAVITGNHWSETDTWAGLGIVECSVARVLFSDDSTWIAPSGAAPPSPSPSAPPVPSPSP
jgi:hypothetical protein